MAVSTRAQNAILAGLAALAVSASAYAIWSVGRPHPSLTEGSDNTGLAPVVIHAPDEDRATATTAPAEDETATATAPPEETEEPTAEPEATISDWVAAWQDDDAHLLAVGDGYSNLPSQWIQEWGILLGQDRPLLIHHWGETLDVAFNDPVVLSETDGPALTIWSASRDGSTIADAAQRFAMFAGRAEGEVDAVLVSLGRSSGEEDVAAGLDQLLAEIDEDLPVLVVVGPEDLYEPEVADATLEWAEDNADRVSIVDLRDLTPASASAQEWAQAFEETLAEE